MHGAALPGIGITMYGPSGGRNTDNIGNSVMHALALSPVLVLFSSFWGLRNEFAFFQHENPMPQHHAHTRLSPHNL